MKSRFRRVVSNIRFFRFFLSSLFGLFLDVTFAFCLTKIVGLNLLLSSSVSLVSVAVLMYFVHEYWTYGRSESSISFSRFAYTLVSTMFSALGRISSIYVSSRVLGFGDAHVYGQLFVASIFSFSLNFLLVELIFSGSRNSPKF
ncbi:GtrA family protein [Rhizobium rhizogenes]|uniref:GtrA family protein n=1 Tax=Rhizobium rhizogenes TaxID=359 RepID=UPI00386833A1